MVTISGYAEKQTAVSAMTLIANTAHDGMHSPKSYTQTVNNTVEIHWILGPEGKYGEATWTIAGDDIVFYRDSFLTGLEGLGFEEEKTSRI